jgi:hypothetical protein
MSHFSLDVTVCSLFMMRVESSEGNAIDRSPLHLAQIVPPSVLNVALNEGN